MYDKKKDPLYIQALKLSLEGRDHDIPTLPNGNWGIDPETNKVRTLGRAKRDLRKHFYDLRRMDLTFTKLRDLLEECDQGEITQPETKRELASV